MNDDGNPQVISHRPGSAVIVLPGGLACSYWWRETRLLADGQTFLVRLAEATGLAEALEASPQLLPEVRKRCGMTDDRPVWSVEKVTEDRQACDPGVLPDAPIWLVPPTLFDAEGVHGTGAGPEEDELMRLARHAIARHLSGPTP